MSNRAPWLGRYDDFVKRASELDRPQVRALVVGAWDEYGPVAVVDEWLMPMLRVVGTAWELGYIGVAAEHLVSQEVRRQLRLRIDADLAPAGSPAVLVATAPGVRHDVGVLAFTALLHRRGVAATPLREQPLDVVVRTVNQIGAAHAVFAVTVLEDISTTAGFLSELSGRLPDLALGVGGRHVGAFDPPVRRFPAHLAAAAADLADELGVVPRGGDEPAGCG